MSNKCPAEAVLASINEQLKNKRLRKPTKESLSKLEGLMSSFVNVKNSIESAEKFKRKKRTKQYNYTPDGMTRAEVEKETKNAIRNAEKLPSRKSFDGRLTNHTGGAYGADSIWADMFRELGVANNHYRPINDKYDPNKPTKVEKFKSRSQKLAEKGDNIEIVTGKEHEAGDALNFFLNNNRDALNNRNLVQVLNADVVYAVAPIVNNKPTGGTASAISLGLALDREVYVLNTEDVKWYRWDGEYWVPTEGIPPSTTNFAAIGTRKIESYPKGTKRQDEKGNTIFEPSEVLGNTDAIKAKMQEFVNGFMDRFEPIPSKFINSAINQLGELIVEMGVISENTDLHEQVKKAIDSTYGSEVEAFQAVEELSKKLKNVSTHPVILDNLVAIDQALQTKMDAKIKANSIVPALNDIYNVLHSHKVGPITAEDFSNSLTNAGQAIVAEGTTEKHEPYYRNKYLPKLRKLYKEIDANNKKVTELYSKGKEDDATPLEDHYTETLYPRVLRLLKRISEDNKSLPLVKDHLEYVLGEIEHNKQYEDNPVDTLELLTEVGEGLKAPDENQYDMFGSTPVISEEYTVEDAMKQEFCNG